MLYSPDGGADIHAVINAAFQTRLSDYKLIIKSWYGNLFARAIFNIKSAKGAEFYIAGTGGGGRKMKVTRMGIGKVRSPYNVPLEGKTLGAIARHSRANWNRTRRTRHMQIRLPRLA